MIPVLGLGTDIVEIDRIKSIMARHPKKFLDRLFTPREQEYCLKRKEPALHFAGRFAAKEAVVKALGTGFSQGLTWKDFEIIPNPNGKPEVILSPSAIDLCGQATILVSISHCDHYATATAIWINQL